ncbi:MAG TPA: type IV pilus biogenesis/stability protein PilW [Zeimonas sp.]
MKASFALAGAFASLLWLAGCATGGASGSEAGASAVTPAVNSALPGSPGESEERRRARIRLELAASYYQQGNFTVALDELRQAIEIDPGYAPVYGVLGLVYHDLGDRDRAEDAFQHGLRIAPDDADLNNSYGWFLCQTGRERASLERFARALKDPLYRTPAKPLHNAGICALRIGDEETAERNLQRAFQVDPSNAVAMYHLAELYLKRGEAGRSRFYSQRLLNAYEPNAQTLWLALRVEHALGNVDNEKSLAAQLRRRFPDSPESALLVQGRFGG